MALKIADLPEGLRASNGDAALIGALGVAVYTTDAAGRITLFNEAAVNLWGRRPIVGQDLWCGSWNIFTPEGEPLPLDQCPMAVALRENRPVRDVEIIVERPDGSRANVLPHPSPLQDEGGRLIGAVNVLIDITDRKKAEEAAHRLSAIVESSDDAIVSKDLNGIVSSWNSAAERMFGYKAEEMVGRSIRTIIPAEHQGEEDEVLSRISRGERVEHFETIRQRKDGSYIDISLTVSPVKGSDGRIIGASKIARDISERRTVEAELQRAYAMKDEFLSLVSHELRTPISIILGNALIFQRRWESLTQEDRVQMVEDVVSQAEKLRANLENLLLLTKLESRQLELEPVSLSAIAIKAVAEFQKTRPERDVRLTQPAMLPPALGHEALLSLVFQNLLTNADKYSPPEKPIEVNVRLNDLEQLEVRVRDFGIGLDDGAIEHLFTPFYRSPRAKGLATGLGLGLAVSKRVLEVQNGSISACTRAEGGSDFFFSLPLAAE